VKYPSRVEYRVALDRIAQVEQSLIERETGTVKSAKSVVVEVRKGVAQFQRLPIGATILTLHIQLLHINWHLLAEYSHDDIAIQCLCVHFYDCI
jgi:hypothetical protein